MSSSYTREPQCDFPEPRTGGQERVAAVCTVRPDRAVSSYRSLPPRRIRWWREERAPEAPCSWWDFCGSESYNFDSDQTGPWKQKQTHPIGLWSYCSKRERLYPIMVFITTGNQVISEVGCSVILQTFVFLNWTASPVNLWGLSLDLRAGLDHFFSYSSANGRRNTFSAWKIALNNTVLVIQFLKKTDKKYNKHPWTKENKQSARITG